VSRESVAEQSIDPYFQLLSHLGFASLAEPNRVIGRSACSTLWPSRFSETKPFWGGMGKDSGRFAQAKLPKW